MITSKHINARGEVALWEATDDGHNKVMMPATDAAHALTADPERWQLVEPSEFGGDSPPSVMDPGPQPAPESDQTPAYDDPSKQGSG